MEKPKFTLNVKPEIIDFLKSKMKEIHDEVINTREFPIQKLVKLFQIEPIFKEAIQLAFQWDSGYLIASMTRKEFIAVKYLIENLHSFVDLGISVMVDPREEQEIVSMWMIITTLYGYEVLNAEITLYPEKNNHSYHN